MPGRVMANGAARSLTVASPAARRATIARRVGSAKAVKVASSWSAATVMLASPGLPITARPSFRGQVIGSYPIT